MSKFNAPRPNPAKPVTKAAPAAVSKAPVKTEVRNTPIPKVTPAAKPAAKQVTHEAIAERAYYIWKQNGGSEFENWVRAESELRAGK